MGRYALLESKRRWHARAMRKRLLLVLPLLSACSQFDGAKLEAAIKSKFESEKVAVREVKCPANRELKAADSFTCEGVSGLGDKFTVKVTQKDDQGNVNWELDGKIFDPVEYSEKALRHFTNNRKVDCGSERFIAVKGTKMTCTVEGGKSATVEFKEDGSLDADGLMALIGGN